MMLPRFKPQQVSEHDGKIEVVGSVSSDNFRGQVWLGAKWIGYIGRVGEAPIEGRWFPVGSQWKFVSEDRQALAFKKEEELCLYDGYWGVYLSLLESMAYSPLPGLFIGQGLVMEYCWREDRPGAASGQLTRPECRRYFVGRHCAGTKG